MLKTTDIKLLVIDKGIDVVIVAPLSVVLGLGLGSSVWKVIVIAILVAISAFGWLVKRGREQRLGRRLADKTPRRDRVAERMNELISMLESAGDLEQALKHVSKIKIALKEFFGWRSVREFESIARDLAKGNFDLAATIENMAIHLHAKVDRMHEAAIRAD